MEKKDRDILIGALKVLNERMMFAIDNDKQFVVQALFETGDVPHSVIVSSRKLVSKFLGMFKTFYNEMIALIEGGDSMVEFKKEEEKSTPSKGVIAHTEKKEDGSIIINFNQKI